MVIANVLKEKAAQGTPKNILKEEENLLGRTLSFGRIGKACMGRPGLLAVNISVMLTQLGFTTGYFIFLGNTLRSVLKYFLVHEDPFHNMTKSFTTLSTRNLSTTLITTTLATTTKQLTTTNASFVNSTVIPEIYLGMFTNGSLLNNIHHHILKAIQEPLSPHNLILNSYATFTVLLLIPVPILVGISFIRNLRKLGPVSVIANVSITGAFAATAIYVITGKELFYLGFLYDGITWKIR